MLSGSPTLPVGSISVQLRRLRMSDGTRPLDGCGGGGGGLVSVPPVLGSGFGAGVASLYFLSWAIRLLPYVTLMSSYLSTRLSQPFSDRSRSWCIDLLMLLAIRYSLF